jgi:tight adherence protein C
VQAVEEAAAKTTIKLLFPLVIFIFPSLFVVVLGPALLSIMDSFKGLSH